jgi:hypothetical protein
VPSCFTEKGCHRNDFEHKDYLLAEKINFPDIGMGMNISQFLSPLTSPELGTRDNNNAYMKLQRT